jgi:hypothetical protein
MTQQSFQFPQCYLQEYRRPEQNPTTRTFEAVKKGVLEKDLDERNTFQLKHLPGNPCPQQLDKIDLFLYGFLDIQFVILTEGS